MERTGFAGLGVPVPEGFHIMEEAEKAGLNFLEALSR